MKTSDCHSESIEKRGIEEICYRALAWQALADGKNHLIKLHFKNHARVHRKKQEEIKKELREQLQQGQTKMDVRLF